MTTERRAAANGIELCYDTFGDPADPALLLVAGFTAQMVSWRREFCEMFAEAGFHVIRYDNRDVGHSTKTTGDAPDVLTLVMRGQSGDTVDPSEVPYTLSDMAADGIGLLDALGIDTAHVVGASMGGMIVQHMAIEHPHRVASVTSIMSSTGNHEVGTATDEALGALLAPPAADRAGLIEQTVHTSKVIGGSLWDEDEARLRAAEALDRMHHPEGPPFQLAALIAAGDRTERLGAVTAPFLVIHGPLDTLIDISGGHATAAAVPGAELLVLDEMGHDMPEALWPQMVGAIAEIAGVGAQA
ncbi:MAG: alpha/beta hydrolase [Actinomycetota bacterium]